MVNQPDYLDLISPTYIENWPKQLAVLSLRQASLALTLEEAHLLGSLNGIHKHLFRCPDQTTLTLLNNKLEELFYTLPDGGFVRLGSRSPKDTALAILTGGFAANGNSALSLLTDGSSRVAFDLKLAIQKNYSPHIFLREWLNIEPWMEFRCFMFQRELVGISQYYHDDPHIGAFIHSRRERILTSISQFFPKFRDACHLDTVLLDLVVRPNISNSLETILLEINPWIAAADFCLFESEERFNGSFLYTA